MIHPRLSNGNRINLCTGENSLPELLYKKMKLQKSVLVLISKVKDLETRHKNFLDPMVLQDLTKARLDLQDLLGIRI